MHQHGQQLPHADLDRRVRCSECRFLRDLTCLQPTRAALSSGELSAAFTRLLQHCPGYTPKASHLPVAQHPTPVTGPSQWVQTRVRSDRQNALAGEV
jgi:hypothetical protein